ncbi:portal protein [Acidovorax sp.]|uniref:portal protein n=1 Tax=Acidovorax sp. TaxID=1872122 RepID=UPI003D020496
MRNPPFSHPSFAVADGLTSQAADDIAALVASGAMGADEVLALLAEASEADAAQQRIDDDEFAAQQRREAEARAVRVGALGRRLLTLAQEQVQQRQVIEERWYKDVRQFNGQYDPGMFGDEGEYGSRVFVPLTRRLCGLVEARLFDMLFPSEERNYVIEPTPVPDLDEALDLAGQLPPDTPMQSPEGPMLTAGGIHQAIGQMVDEAAKRCDAMQREIDDQLAECSYPRHARDVIHDAVLYGTGVLKGPVPMFRTTKRWARQGDGAYVMSLARKPLPQAARVDLWNFFPDMSSTHIREAEFVFERHYLTRQEAADLQDMPDVDADALRRMLGAEPTTPTNNYRERLRAISGASGAKDRRYEVWEYHGPITAQDLIDCGCAVEDDPLKTYTGVVWFGSQGEVLKAALNPLDSNEHPYSVFTWQMDEASIFGFGMPYEVRDNQESANSAFRAMHDNMGLCVLPQVVVDDQAIEPVDGSWRMAPGKFWRNKRPGSDARQGIQFIAIDARLQELQAIFGMSKQLIEEVGTLPAFLQGTEAPSYMQSATGASIAYNAANLWVRRAVRNWDDDIVTPLITRFFDWNMQYSEKAEIKGDSRVRALGIAALVELEGQAQRLQAFMQTAQAMGLPPSNQMRLMREFARAFKLDPDRVLPTEHEIARMQQAEAQQPPGKSGPDAERVAQQREQAAMDGELEKARLQLRRDEAMAQRELAQQRMALDAATSAARERTGQTEAQRRQAFEVQKTRAVLADRQADRDSKAQMLNAEMAFSAQMGKGV